MCASDSEGAILVTGAAGFIGFHLTNQLIRLGVRVIGLDNINDYYAVNLKYGRLYELGIEKERIRDNELIDSSKSSLLSFIKCDLTDRENLRLLFDGFRIKAVVNLAAQAGVRYSIHNPSAYIQSNIVGFANLIELAKGYGIDHFIYASSSSVYGTNEKMPFSADDSVDHPASLYAATKKSNELIAHSYSHLFGLRTTGLRFFTVYGPWGRPDMALFLFTEAIISGKPLDVYNNGNMSRDFTFVDDIVTGLVNIILDRVTPAYMPADPPYKLYNIGNGAPVKLLDFIDTIENELCCSTGHNYLPLQPGDVVATWADTEALYRDYGFRPSTPIETGVSRFLNWYRIYYNV